MLGTAGATATAATGTAATQEESPTGGGTPAGTEGSATGTEGGSPAEGGGGGGGGGVPQLPNSAKTLGIATTVVTAATLGLTYVFLRYGGDYEMPGE